MNISKLAISFFSALLLFSSCDDNTSGLGSSLIPDGDEIKVTSDSCFATTKSILSPDSLLVKTVQYNLGRYTEPNSGATFQSAYLTQLNCLENYKFPDSVYGIGNFKFPDWFVKEVGDRKKYYANLRLYYSDFFGDPTNIIKVEVFPLKKIIDPDTKYYPNFDPAEFCDLDKEPLATATLSGWNLQIADSLRYDSNFYPYVSISLPDTLAQRILETYYKPGGKDCFANSTAFMENVMKGFYVRCSQGDGTVLYIDFSRLEVYCRCITKDEDGKEKLESPRLEFVGNNEVLQLNSIKWSGLEAEMAETGCTWIRSPFGILTEITLPIDDMKDESTVLNAAQLRLSSANTPSDEYKPSVPPTVALIRKEKLKEFFEKNTGVDKVNSFVASYASQYGTYTFDNIAALVEKIYSDRADWIKSNNITTGAKEAYAAAHPDWNKMVLVPVRADVSSQREVINYRMDLNIHQVKLIGGPDNKIKIKVIRSSF